MEKKYNKKIDIHHVKGSSTIIRVDYDHLMDNMKVYFKTGGVYTYTGVPYNVFEEMCLTESAGNYFHKQIKGVYDFMKETKNLPKKQKSFDK